jgi:hypothetical protein
LVPSKLKAYRLVLDLGKRYRPAQTPSGIEPAPSVFNPA